MTKRVKVGLFAGLLIVLAGIGAAFAPAHTIVGKASRAILGNAEVIEQTAEVVDTVFVPQFFPEGLPDAGQ